MKRQRAWLLTSLIGLVLVFFVIIPAAVVTSKKKHQAQADKSAYPLDVMLKAVRDESDTEVLVTIKNNGNEDLNLFARGGLLDPNPVLHKFNMIAQDGSKPRFVGVHPRVSRENLSEYSFHSLPAKATAELHLDVSYLFDVSKGGVFEVSSEGKIPFAAKSSTELIGTGIYSSNKITMNITRGTRSSLESLSQKTVLQPDCSNERAQQTGDANALCALISAVAGGAAISGDAEQFYRYFRTYDPRMRQLVSKRFYAVADECAGRTRVSTTYCSDQLNLCQSDYIAVTLGTRVYNCDIFWRFPLINNQCHGYDKATTVIHEITHVDGVLDPSTVDFPDNYGWPKLTYLTAEQAVTNADNYQYYANAVSTGTGC